MRQTLALSTTPTRDNSPVSEVAYSVESMDDGIYSATTQTRYNAEGQPLNTTQKELISQLSPAIESKSVFISERGLAPVYYLLGFVFCIVLRLVLRNKPNKGDIISAGKEP